MGNYINYKEHTMNHFTKCMCNTEGIEISVENYFNNKVKIASIHFWEMGGSFGDDRPSLWNRIKSAWYVLRKGHSPFAWDLELDVEGLKTLKKNIEDVIKEMEGKNAQDN